MADMIRLDGKLTAQTIRGEVADEVRAWHRITGRTPGLAVIVVGDNPASAVYVRNKRRACEEVGFYSEIHALPEDTTEDTLLCLIRRLNAANRIDGILVQLPLPEHMHQKLILDAISPEKDVDAFHPYLMGSALIGTPILLPCTPAGILELLHRYEIPIKGKHAVVVGRSNIVGKPIAFLLLSENATVTVCHSATVGLADYTRTADILVCAVGKPHMITSGMVKPGAIVIDVGINRTDEGKLIGDVDYDDVSDIAGGITPVPGGVGPMTIAMLLKNTLTAAKRRNQG